MNAEEPLRMALVAGGLGKGGAEKQLIYLIRALSEQGVAIQLLSMTQGEYYEAEVTKFGIAPVWFGQSSHRVKRINTIIQTLQAFRPHIVHSSHFFTNLYAVIGAKWAGAIPVGSIRGNVDRSMRVTGHWGRWLLRLPAFLVVNSIAAQRAAIDQGIIQERVLFLPNVIDLKVFDRQKQAAHPYRKMSGEVIATTIARLIPLKRVDLFLKALWLARRSAPQIKGVIVGDGPERGRLEAQASELGLLPDGVSFLGQREDVPELLAQTDLFVHPSDSEGFPNVLLEAMAAGLPVVTTQAGDAERIVHETLSGFVVPVGNADILADRMILLAKSGCLRKKMGQEGRLIAEQDYDFGTLGHRAISLYCQMAHTQAEGKVLKVLDRYTNREGGHEQVIRSDQ